MTNLFSSRCFHMSDFPSDNVALSILLCQRFPLTSAAARSVPQRRLTRNMLHPAIVYSKSQLWASTADYLKVASPFLSVLQDGRISAEIGQSLMNDRTE